MQAAGRPRVALAYVWLTGIVTLSVFVQGGLIGAWLYNCPNPPKDTDGRREDSGRGWVRELQGRWPGVMG